MPAWLLPTFHEDAGVARVWLLPASSKMSSSLLPASSKMSSSLLPAFHAISSSLLPAPQKDSSSLLPVFQEMSSSLLPAYAGALALAFHEWSRILERFARREHQVIQS
jgi:hypothetical protein